jgi:uncharacterized membrane protein (UPF0127 family)
LPRAASSGLGHFAASLALALALLACAPAAPAESGPGAADGTMPPLLAGLQLTTVTIGTREYAVAIADTPAARSRGLAGTTDLGPLDGMLFAYQEPVETGFFMRGVAMALDIAFVGVDGRVLSVLTMPLCTEDPCPTYAPSSPFMWAIETPAGGLSGVAAGDLIEIASG